MSMRIDKSGKNKTALCIDYTVICTRRDTVRNFNNLTALNSNISRKHTITDKHTVFNDNHMVQFGSCNFMTSTLLSIHRRSIHQSHITSII